MSASKILLLGDQRLYQNSKGITQNERTQLHSVVKDQQDAMMAFREVTVRLLHLKLVS